MAVRDKGFKIAGGGRAGDAVEDFQRALAGFIGGGGGKRGLVVVGPEVVGDADAETEFFEATLSGTFEGIGGEDDGEELVDAFGVADDFHGFEGGLAERWVLARLRELIDERSDSVGVAENKQTQGGDAVFDGAVALGGFQERFIGGGGFEAGEGVGDGAVAVVSQVECVEWAVTLVGTDNAEGADDEGLLGFGRRGQEGEDVGLGGGEVLVGDGTEGDGLVGGGKGGELGDDLVSELRGDGGFYEHVAAGGGGVGQRGLQHLGGGFAIEGGELGKGGGADGGGLAGEGKGGREFTIGEAGFDEGALDVGLEGAGGGGVAVLEGGARGASVDLGEGGGGVGRGSGGTGFEDGSEGADGTGLATVSEGVDVGGLIGGISCGEGFGEGADRRGGGDSREAAAGVVADAGIGIAEQRGEGAHGGLGSDEFEHADIPVTGGKGAAGADVLQEFLFVGALAGRLGVDERLAEVETSGLAESVVAGIEVADVGADVAGVRGGGGEREGGGEEESLDHDERGMGR